MIEATYGWPSRNACREARLSPKPILVVSVIVQRHSPSYLKNWVLGQDNGRQSSQAT